MLQDSGEIGEMEYEIFKFNIKSLDSHERDLISVGWIWCPVIIKNIFFDINSCTPVFKISLFKLKL